MTSFYAQLRCIYIFTQKTHKSMFENKIKSFQTSRVKIFFLNVLFKINTTCIFGQSEEVTPSHRSKSTTIYMYWTSKTTYFFCDLTCRIIEVWSRCLLVWGEIKRSIKEKKTFLVGLTRPELRLCLILVFYRWCFPQGWRTR